MVLDWFIESIIHQKEKPSMIFRSEGFNWHDNHKQIECNDTNDHKWL